MKKTFLPVLSLVICGFFTTLHAQVGIKGGINLSTVVEENDEVSREDFDNKSIVGPVLGLTFDLGVNDFFSIQPEIYYSQSGGKNTYRLLGSVTESVYRINYIEVPILAKLKFGNAEQQGVGIYVAAGPFAGYALNGKREFKTEMDGTVLFENKEDFTFNNEDNARRLNYGLTGAAGVMFGRLSFDLRYNYGINNLLDKDADNNNDNKPILRTQGLALTLGYSF